MFAVDPYFVLGRGVWVCVSRDLFCNFLEMKGLTAK